MNSNCQIAWAAGLFEGEGSCYLARTQNNRPVLELTSTDEDVITRFAEIMGVGHIYYTERKRVKPFWRWSISRRDDVVTALNMLMPYLGERRKASAQQVLERTKTMKDYSRRLTQDEKRDLLRKAGF